MSKNIEPDVPQFLVYSNMETLQPHLQQIFTKNKNSTQVIIQLTDTDTYIIPDDYISPAKDSHGVPLHWVEFYVEDVTKEIDREGIVVMIHETVDNPHVSGEIAYTWSVLKKLALEYDLTLSLYAGFYLAIGLLTGGRLSPELDLLSSMSILYACSVNPGKTVMIKIYPTIANVTPYYKKANWNENLQKFIFKKGFTKHQRMRLLALTGLEDVECLYVDP
ncbi:hypothetical protein Cantr_02747 [Candida viswanathii]|uniref:Uncharacterized protein n=1 Tax=Candida viswanathii TaxID=5486 RepID=A0A367YNV6_9ASCO|nr:hypothetical protein Cantr_02747 [Candida viswanathii]